MPEICISVDLKPTFWLDPSRGKPFEQPKEEKLIDYGRKRNDAAG